MRVLTLRNRKKIQYNSFKEKVKMEDIITITFINAQNNVRMLWESYKMLF